MDIPTLRTCHFEASEYIMTKFKTQALHTTRIQYRKTSRNGNSPSLILALLKIAIYIGTKYEIFFTIQYFLFNIFFPYFSRYWNINYWWMKYSINCRRGSSPKYLLLRNALTFSLRKSIWKGKRAKKIHTTISLKK